ncbi:MAG: hypothetical protein ABI863_04675 [Ginsengibacter sp.]
MNLIKGDGSAPQPNTDVLVRGGSIADVGKSVVAPGVTTIDLTGKFMIPAIISAHVHVLKKK